MATFTTIALDRLIEPKPSKPMAAGKAVAVNGTDKQQDLENSRKSIEKKHHWTQISPALYATPEPTPLPDSPSSFVPSPYIVNHKRRGPRLSKAFSEDDAALSDQKTSEIVRSLEAEDVGSSEAVIVTNNVHKPIEDDDAKFVINDENRNDNIADDSKSVMLESEMDDFFDPQDSLSVKSSSDGESSFGVERSLNLNSSASEFYDAWEELSSESGSQPSSNDIETELREMRLSLLVEIERRKQAEDRINDMQNRWGKICKQLSLAGLNLPADNLMVEDQYAEELVRQVDLIRFVSNSIGRGVAKAELEEEMKAQLESKNFEIARLLDKVRYYEAVNHEMCQRNQESMEAIRRRRQRRKQKQIWIWSSVVAVGSAVLVWSYLPTGKVSSHTSDE